jgi:dihydrofolate reductase
MPRLSVFNQVSLDGFIADANGDMSWAHKADPEWNAFVESNASSGGRLLFGRLTYDLMTRYWPTPMAMEHDPVVAERMNNLPKVVFSRTLDKATWTNTELVKNDIAGWVRKAKTEPGPDMVIFGSATIIPQLAAAGLIDEYQIVVNPIVLGAGKSMFAGLEKPLDLERTKVRAFQNGNLVLDYRPA